MFSSPRESRKRRGDDSEENLGPISEARDIDANEVVRVMGFGIDHEYNDPKLGPVTRVCLPTSAMAGHIR